MDRAPQRTQKRDSTRGMIEPVKDNLSELFDGELIKSWADPPRFSGRRRHGEYLMPASIAPALRSAAIALVSAAGRWPVRFVRAIPSERLKEMWLARSRKNARAYILTGRPMTFSRFAVTPAGMGISDGEQLGSPHQLA